MREQDILNKVRAHHEIVEAAAEEYGYEMVVFTSLIGSQNYGLETEYSDIDTCSFILPTYMDFIRGLKPFSKEIELKDGKIVIKDLREAFELLRRPSPNSIEWFVSNYIVFNKDFEDILKTRLGYPFSLIHANYKNMQDALIGTARGLHGRNMSMGKKYAHLLRLKDLATQYFKDAEITRYPYLEMPTYPKERAYDAKVGNIIITEEEYNKELEEITSYIASFPSDTKDCKVNEYVARHEINKLQYKIFKKYLELVT